MAKAAEGKLTAKLVLETDEFYEEIERAKAALLELEKLQKRVLPAVPVPVWPTPMYPTWYRPAYYPTYYVSGANGFTAN